MRVIRTFVTRWSVPTPLGSWPMRKVCSSDDFFYVFLFCVLKFQTYRLEWTAVPAYRLQVEVITKVSCRYFFGEPLCTSDAVYIRSALTRMVKYLQAMTLLFGVCAKRPQWKYLRVDLSDYFLRFSNRASHWPFNNHSLEQQQKKI